MRIVAQTGSHRIYSLSALVTEMTSCKILDPGEQQEAAMRTMACKHRPLVVQPMNCDQVYNRVACVLRTGEGKGTI